MGKKTADESMIVDEYNPGYCRIRLPYVNHGYDFTGLNDHFKASSLSTVQAADLIGCIMRFESGSVNNAVVMVTWTWKMVSLGDVESIQVEIFRKTALNPD